MKACPFCAEMVQDEAIKCRHCGKWIDQDEEAKRAQAAGDSSKFGVVKIYSYMLLGGTAMFLLGIFFAFIMLHSGPSGPSAFPGLPELLLILIFLTTFGALIFVALGLLKRKRVAFIMNMVVLALGLVCGLINITFAPIPSARFGGVLMIIWAAVWLVYFAGKKRLFPN